MSVLDLPDTATVTLTVGELRKLVEQRMWEAFEPAKTGEASRLTGLSARQLQRLHGQWQRAQDEGRRPAVLVSRTSEAGDLLFHRPDLVRYAGRAPEGQRPRRRDLEPGVDPNDPDAIADRILAEGRE